MNNSYQHTQNFAEVITLCKQFLSQNPSISSSLADVETYHYFKNLKIAPPLPQKQAQLGPQAPIIQQAKPIEKIAPKPQILPAPVVPKIAEKKIIETKESLPTPPPAPESMVSQLLPKPFHKKEPLPLDDMKEKIQKYAPLLKTVETPLSDIEAIKKASAWKELYPKCAIISFLPPASSEAKFLKNVFEAIKERLTTAKLYFPATDALLELLLLAEHNHLKTIIVAYTSESSLKVNDFTSQLVRPTEKKEALPNLTPLTLRGSLFNTQLVDLVVTESMQNNPQEKAALWKMLRTLTQ